MTSANKPAVAFIGASERSRYAVWGMKNLRLFNPELEIWPVTPTHAEILGYKTFPSVKDLPYTPTAAVVAVRRELALEALRDLVEMGVTDIAFIAAGFTERGDAEGAQLTEEFEAILEGSTARVFGPNCIGFADFTAGICCITEPLTAGAEVGDVSFISQSGALLSSVLSGFKHEGLGADFFASIGNGTNIDINEALEYVVGRPTTQVICCYIEAFEPEGLERALAAAQAADKPVIVIKGGASEQGTRVVLNHTASVAGDDAAFDAMLQKYGAHRVYSTDEMLRLATLVGHYGLRPGSDKGVLVLGNSGGGASLAADAAVKLGTRLAVLSDVTLDRLKEITGPGSFLENPFDILAPTDTTSPTGTWATAMNDPDTGFAVMSCSVQLPDFSDEEDVHRNTWQAIADMATLTGTPVLFSSITTGPETPFVTAYREKNPHLRVVHDMSKTLQALARFFPADKLNR